MPPIIPREKYKANFQRENRRPQFRSNVNDFQNQLQRVRDRYADYPKVTEEIDTGQIIKMI